MEYEEFILPDRSPPDNPIQSERAKRASSSIMEYEEFILPDWSPPDDLARPYQPKAGNALFVIDIHQMMIFSLFPTSFDHFYFHGFGGLILWYDLRL